MAQRMECHRYEGMEKSIPEISRSYPVTAFNKQVDALQVYLQIITKLLQLKASKLRIILWISQKQNFVYAISQSYSANQRLRACSAIRSVAASSIYGKTTWCFAGEVDAQSKTILNRWPLGRRNVTFGETEQPAWSVSATRSAYTNGWL